MRRALALAALLLFAGCSSSEPSAADLTPAERESVFLEAAHQVSGLAAADDATLLDTGHSICDSFGGLEGGPKESEAWLVAVKGFTDAGLSGEAAGGIIATSVAALCPDLMHMLPSTG